MSRMSLRLRLTVLYGVLFLLAGVVMLVVTYALMEQQVPGAAGAGGIKIDKSIPPGVTEPPPEKQFVVIEGQTVNADDLPQLLREKTLGSLVTQGSIALGVVGAAAIAFGWLIAGRTLQPLHKVTETARRIASAPAADRGLHERIGLTGPHDEVRELADTFDVMLQRLDQSFEGQRRFVSNASHELRTPLTLNRALIEVAMHRKTASEDVKQLGETLLEVNVRHERLINGLLLLARSESGVTDPVPVDVAEVAEYVVDQTREEASAAGVSLDLSAEPAPTVGDAVLVERVVQNLVHNGVRHNSTGGWVTVRTGRGPDGGALVVVANTGPVVPGYEIQSLFEPFRRLDAERLVTSRGVGLGLSIVRSVARAHGGDVVALPRDGGGLVVTVTFPAA